MGSLISLFCADKDRKKDTGDSSAETEDGDEKQQFKTLLRPHIDFMYRTAYRLAQSQADAEDIVQEVLIRLAGRVEEMRNIEQLRPWLIKIVYHRYIDLYRSQRSSPIDTESSFHVHPVTDEDSDQQSNHTKLEQQPEPGNRYDQLDLRDTLQKALWSLDREQREVVMLHDVEGYSASEVAGIAGVSPGTVKSRLHRARKKLKYFLKAGTF